MNYMQKKINKEMNNWQMLLIEDESKQRFKVDYTN